MIESVWGKLLLVLAPPLLAVFVGAIRAIANNNPSPTKRKYWADELPVRIELANSKELDSGLREKLASRASMAREYLDADEAVRRVRVTGSAPVWLLASSSYILGVGVSLQVNLGNFPPVSTLLGIAFIAIGVWAQLVATQIPSKRQELLRVLVEVQRTQEGYRSLLESPEELVFLWNRYRKSIRKRAAKRCAHQAVIVTYASYATGLLNLNAVYGRYVSQKNKKRGRIRREIEKAPFNPVG